MNILALDLGMKTGWAKRYRDGKRIGGTKVFKVKKSEPQAVRWISFRDWLKEMARDVDAVYYEEVMSHAGVLAAHAYGGYQALLTEHCFRNGIPIYPVAVGTIKKYWAGKGNASKEDMIEVAIRCGFNVKTHDEADAQAILSYALMKEGLNGMEDMSELARV